MYTIPTINTTEHTKSEKFNHYVLYQLARTQSMFAYTGLPDTIPATDMERMLQCDGFVGIAEHNGNLYAFNGGLGGEDVYYRPTWLTVASPALKLSKQYTIGTDCEVIQNDSYYIGLLPLFKRYARAMVENEITLNVADINARIISVITADTDNEKRAADKFLSDVFDGKLSSVMSNAFTQGIKTLPYATSAATRITDLVEYQQYLRATWYNEIGLNANYNMKREVLTSSEVNMNHDSLLPLCDDMLKQRQDGVKRVNKMFGTNITVEFGSTWRERSENQNGGENDVVHATKNTVDGLADR